MALISRANEYCETQQVDSLLCAPSHLVKNYKHARDLSKVTVNVYGETWLIASDSTPINDTVEVGLRQNLNGQRSFPRYHVQFWREEVAPSVAGWRAFASRSTS